MFWPAKLQASDRVVMFRFEFWDCGESALKKFEHMLPVSGQVGLGSGGGASERGLRGLQAPARGPEDAGPAPGAAAAKPGLILPGCEWTGGGKTSRGRQLLVPR